MAPGAQHCEMHSLVVLMLVVGRVREDEVRFDFPNRLLDNCDHLGVDRFETGIGQIMHLDIVHPEECRAIKRFLEPHLAVATIGAVRHHNAVHEMTTVNQPGNGAAAGEFEIIRMRTDHEHLVRHVNGPLEM